MRKLYVFLAIPLAVLSVAVFTVTVQAEVTGCPAGYSCTPVTSKVPNCPAGYVCRATTTTTNAPSFVGDTINRTLPSIPKGGGTTSSSSCYAFSRDLSLGSSGADVVALQSWLMNNGYSIPAVSSGRTPKGYYGSQTAYALGKYQDAVGITAEDGNFGPITRAKLVQSGCQNPVAISQPVPPELLTPSAGIDENSLISYSSMPTLTGYAYNVSHPFGISLSNSGGKIWASGDITVSNNRWSSIINQTLVPGTYTVQVYSNSVLLATRTLIVTTATNSIQPSITVLSPNGGETYSNGADSVINIKWNTQNWKGYPVDIFIVDTAGSIVQYVANAVPNTGTYSFGPSQFRPGQYKIWISANEKGGPAIGEEDKSDNYFTVTSQTTTSQPLSLYVSAPSMSDVFIVGQTARIAWKADSRIDKVTLFYQSESGTVGSIADNVPNVGYYNWTVNVGNTTNTKFRIYMIGYQTGVGSVTAYGDSYFTIKSSVVIPPVVSTTPLTASCLAINPGGGGIAWNATVSGGKTPYAYSWSAYNDVSSYTTGSTQSSTFGALYSTPGTKQAIVRVTDASGAAISASCSGTLVGSADQSKQSITVISPSNGEALSEGTTYTISWSSTGLTASDYIHIMLTDPSGADKVYVAWWLPGTQTSFAWKVGTGIGGAGITPPVTGSSNKIKVYTSTGSAVDSSDNAFVISAVNNNTYPLVTVVGTPVITKTNISDGVSADTTFVYRANFNVNVNAIGGPITVGLPGSSWPAFGASNVSSSYAQIYKNGAADTSGGLNLTASYSAPSTGATISSDGNSFTLSTGSSVTIPVTYSFTVFNPGANTYGVRLTGMGWSSATQSNQIISVPSSTAGSGTTLIMNPQQNDVLTASIWDAIREYFKNQ